ncbi:MAG: Fic family protein [Burkholderiales bacterium]|nr:Fic family protein [Burkholderiales bacterium]
MKLPLTPPDVHQLIAGNKPEQFIKLVSAIRSQVIEGQYLHWDELRHRKPPAGVASAEDWWTGVKMARIPLYRALDSLLDKSGKPFVFGLPEPVLVALHHIDRDAAGKIASAADIAIPEQRDRYIWRSLVEEAITSSQLEGASTTRQVAKTMLQEGRKPRDRSERMIFNNYRAMELIRTFRKDSVTTERILELHRILTEDTLDDPADAGRLRQADDVRVEDNRDGTLIHQPPPHTELSGRLERLCEFANSTEITSPFIHPVIRAILVHFMIGYDHPFVDGNGRTARALFYWVMARQGYWLMEFLSISHVLRKAPSQYVRAYLHTETDGNDTTYFIIHQLDVIHKSIAALHEYLDHAAKEQRATEKLLTASPRLRDRLNHRQIALLTHALKHPGFRYRIEGHQRTHVTAYQTARSDLLALTESGLLSQSKSGKAYVFTAPADLRKRIDKLA